jgi:arylsulfatase A-like enzyme
VGKLLDYLDNENLAENTIVIYTSDQGFFLGEHGWFDKRFIYEESFQMPFLLRYPSLLKAGQINNDMCCNVDFAPTFLDFAGLSIPNYMQGDSLKPILEGKTPDNWQQIAYQRYWMHRDPDHNAYAHYGLRDQRYKIIYWYNDGFDLPGTNHGGEDKEWELFDCETDPLELFNLANDKNYNEVFSRMKLILTKKMLEIGDIPAHDQ